VLRAASIAVLPPPSGDARAVLAGDAQPARCLGAEAEKYYVMPVAQLPETNSGTDIGVVLERDTEFEQALDLGIQYIVGQAVLGYCTTQHAADRFTAFVNSGGVTATSHLVSEGQTRRAGADDADRFLVASWHNRGEGQRA